MPELLALFSLAVIFFIAGRLYPIWNNRFQGCDAYNILLCAETLRKNRRLPIKLPHLYLLEEQEQWYPPGFIVLCALIPEHWLKTNYWLLNHLVDLVQVVIIFLWATCIGHPIIGVCMVLIYGMMPALIQEYASMNTRPLGAALQSCFLIAIFFTDLYPYLIIAPIILSVLLFYSHKLSLQQLWFTLPIIFILTGELKWLLWLPGVYFFSMIIWPRGFFRIIKGHLAIIKFWHRYWPLLGAHSVRQSPIYGDGFTRTDFYNSQKKLGRLAFFKETLHQNYFVVTAFFICWLKSSLNQFDIFLAGWIISAYVSAIAINYLQLFRGIGLGRQYVKFGILPTLLLIILNCDLNSTGVFILFLGSGVLELRQYVMVSQNLRTQSSFQSGLLAIDLKKMLEELARIPSCRVMCLPTHLCDLVAYQARVQTYWGTHSHCFDEKLADFFPVLRHPIAEYVRSDRLTHLLLDNRYVTAKEVGLSEADLVCRHASFDLYRIYHLPLIR